MFKNLFNYEENENVVEFVEEEVIENEEELDTLLDNVKAIVVNTVKVAVKVVKGVAKVVKTAGMAVLITPFIAYSAGKAVVKGVRNKIERKRKNEKMIEIMTEHLRDYGKRTGKIK